METTAGHRLGKNVQNERKRQGIGKIRFCLMAGISRPLLDKVEDGTSNITLSKLEAIAKGLGVEPWELLR
ncbi:MAG: helix-turn-helix transcriptional regulator [Collinsella sp.]|nr:helix-turn-helix transcriptional regulator [Collinsella sp.]